MNTNRLLPLLFALLALYTLPTGGAAQAPNLSGTYAVTNRDGSPVRENTDVKVDIREEDVNEFTGTVSISVDNGQWQVIAAEEMTLWLATDGVYYWENARGSTGILVWNQQHRLWQSTVLSGPFEGTERNFRR